MLCISILNLGTSTWKKQDAPQYGDSNLTELVRVKPVSKDSIFLSVSMGVTLGKKKKRDLNKFMRRHPPKITAGKSRPQMF